MRTPEYVRLREEAAARCTAKIKRRVLRRQARKARAEHLRCSLVPGKKKVKRKPLTEIVCQRALYRRQIRVAKGASKAL